jgi:hypothetical protein
MKTFITLVLFLFTVSFAECEYDDSFYSSFIDSAMYCPTSNYAGTLTLSLNGTEYDYHVSYSTWVGFQNASSKGRYFNQYIK